MFQAQQIGFAPRMAISTISYYGTLPTGALGSAAFPTINKVIYCPIRIPAPLMVDRFSFGVGAAQSGNVDVGIYTMESHLPARRILNTGSTANAGTSGSVQVIDATNTLIGAGAYFLAVTFDNVTAAMQRVAPAVVLCVIAGIRYETTGAFGLPATAAAADAVDAYFPEINVHGTSVV